MKNEREKLNTIIQQAEELLQKDVTNSSPEFEAWNMKAERFLIHQFGEKSHEYKSFKEINFGCFVISGSNAHNQWVKACHDGVRSAIAILNVYLEDFDEVNNSDKKTLQANSYDRVFIVHGHDGELKHSVARIIEKQGIDAVILLEQVNRGKTIIEKLEGNSDVGGAVCLFTADDVGRENSESHNSLRARQNVVLEAGYFLGKLGREHVVFLAYNWIEMPSDLSGIVYTSTNNWQFDLLKELKAMGYKIDFNKLA